MLYIVPIILVILIEVAHYFMHVGKIWTVLT